MTYSAICVEPYCASSRRNSCTLAPRGKAITKSTCRPSARFLRLATAHGLPKIFIRRCASPLAGHHGTSQSAKNTRNPGQDIPPPGLCSPLSGGTTLSGNKTGKVILISALGVCDLGRSRERARGSAAEAWAARAARDRDGGGGSSNAP